MTEAAKSMARNFERTQLKKLDEAGCLDMAWPISITAQTVGSSAEQSMRTGNDEDESHICTKLIHFQRHGQGYHNLIGEMYRDFLGRPIDLDDKDPAMNPFLREEMLDAPLTEKGRQECAARRTQGAMLSPQVMIVSPLLRAIQTAMLSFGDHADTVDWIAHEGAREQTGLLQCNKRRTRTEAAQEFPHVDFSTLQDDDDVMWQPDARESPKDETQRIYEFLTDFIMKRPEDELAIVGHSAWLFSMCNAVIDCGEAQELRSIFQTSEIRTMRLSFYKTEESPALQ
ncbi:mutase-like protein [Seminavis robusta]|uniref:Mutase-like protein n=1 Tax=Seminavis robusta TaxID=568900 RepID=A0A9N8HVP1_9STRA|nr:mutase-like protein [Seminavis robusta]|eukprot:Sro2380_g325450.1 mutase-like protein (285) ;mRNA; r:10174-11159